MSKSPNLEAHLVVTVVTVKSSGWKPRTVATKSQYAYVSLVESIIRGLITLKEGRIGTATNYDDDDEWASIRLSRKLSQSER